MKHTLIAGLVVFAAALPVRADDIEGVYNGTIWSGDDLPGATIFTISPEGRISGTYVFEGSGGTAAGELSDCMIEERLLRCIWSDEFGRGDFFALFTPDWRGFKGGWFSDIQKRLRAGFDGANRWDGQRAE